MADQMHGREEVTPVGIDIAQLGPALSVECPDGRRERFRTPNTREDHDRLVAFAGALPGGCLTGPERFEAGWLVTVMACSRSNPTTSSGDALLAPRPRDNACASPPRTPAWPPPTTEPLRHTPPSPNVRFDLLMSDPIALRYDSN